MALPKLLVAAGAGIVVAKLPLLVLAGGAWLYLRRPASKPRTA